MHRDRALARNRNGNRRTSKKTRRMGIERNGKGPWKKLPIPANWVSSQRAARSAGVFPWLSFSPRQRENRGGTRTTVKTETRFRNAPLDVSILLLDPIRQYFSYLQHDRINRRTKEGTSKKLLSLRIFSAFISQWSLRQFFLTNAMIDDQRKNWRISSRIFCNESNW